MSGITIYDICKEIPKLGENGRFDVYKARTGKKESVVDGLELKRAPTVEGLHTFTPEELLSIRVPRLEVNSSIQGYQRPNPSREHARKMAVAMLEGKPFPLMEIALDGNGDMYAVDAQHRAIAGVIGRIDVEGVVRRMTKEQQRQLFAGQRKAKAVDRNVLILAGNSSYEEYVQDAVTNNAHPWAQIVSHNNASKTRISPYAMLRLLSFYVGNAASSAISPIMERRWDKERADELAPLTACFGNKQTNPPAFRPSAVLGIGAASMHVFRRNEHLQREDHRRWIEHMPRFPWERYLFLRSRQDFTFHLVAHWNKRLHASRKVTLD